MKTLHNLLSEQEKTQYAIEAGTKTHKKLQRVLISDTKTVGDIDLINKIKQHPNLVSFFCENSKTEVPVAGTVNGQFISRRIDRMCVNHDTKIIDIIDYKTDTCCDTYHDKYVSQVHEYIKLVQQIYPEYKIKGYILWTHNFFLETV